MASTRDTDTRPILQTKAATNDYCQKTDAKHKSSPKWRLQTCFFFSKHKDVSPTITFEENIHIWEGKTMAFSVEIWLKLLNNY